MRENYLEHHGILGMKWGIRRFQNADGSLTDAGKKRVSKEYKKLSVRATEEVVTQDNYIKAYNKAAGRMNDELTEKYNAEYDKKLGEKAKGHDYENDEEYNSGYEKLFDEVFRKSYLEVLDEAYKNNKSYRKAEELCNKYSMWEFDDLAKTNKEDNEALNELRAKKF